MKGPVWSAFAVAGAACLFGMTGTIAAIGPAELSPVAAGAWRSVIGAAVLVFATALVAPARSTMPWATRWAWIGGAGVAGYQLAFFEAVERTGVALGTLITIGVGPPVAGLLEVALNRRRPSMWWLVGSAVAIAGVAVLTAKTSRAEPAGIALAFVAGCSFPLFGLAGQRLMADRPVLPAMAAVFCAGAILTLPIAIGTAHLVVDSPSSLATVATLGIVTLALAYVLWGIGLQALSLGVVVTLTLLEPAVAAVLAVAVLGEQPTRSLAVGLMLVALGVVVSAYQPSRDSNPDANGPGRIDIDASGPDRR